MYKPLACYLILIIVVYPVLQLIKCIFENKLIIAISA